MSCYETIGFYTVLLLVILTLVKAFRFVWTTFLGSSLGQGYHFKHSDDAFAVVTGSTDGIGKFDFSNLKAFSKSLINLSHNWRHYNCPLNNIQIWIQSTRYYLVGSQFSAIQRDP